MVILRFPITWSVLDKDKGEQFTSSMKQLEWHLDDGYSIVFQSYYDGDFAPTRWALVILHKYDPIKGRKGSEAVADNTPLDNSLDYFGKS